VELSHVLTDVIADAQFALGRDDLVKLLILQLLTAQRVVALYLSTLLLMLVDFGQLELLLTKLALNVEGVDDLLDDTASSSDPDVFVATGAVLVQLEPVLDASFAEKLVAVVTLLGVSAYFEAYLAKYEAREILADLKSSYTLWVVADSSLHDDWGRC